MLLNIILWIIFGAIAGWIASLLAGEGARVEGWMNVGLGILGALIGGLLFNALGGPGVTGFNLYSFLVAIVGAVILLLIIRLFR
jgi:uncharacterized membrane protein YeaQ/YmgE (transglycosylase-associated protein family)